MVKIGEIGYRQIIWAVGWLHLIKIARLFNRLLVSSFGVRVVSTQRLGKGWVDRLLYFQRLFNLLESIEGDVVECGVASGYTLSMLASLVRSSGTDRHIWGFDSWEGLPEPSKEDLTSAKSLARKGLLGDSSVELVLENLTWCGFDDSEIKNRITLVKGLFSDTLPKYRGSKIALLHIDVDLYESYKDALRFLWPKVSDGGIIAFDEYQAPDTWPGAKPAADEFFNQLAPGSVRLHKDALFDRYYAVKIV
ncbi:hypothetical protein ES703_125223 [subsurface metagenome]